MAAENPKPIHWKLRSFTATPNYRFVCPQLAESTNLAEVHQKHNGIHKALRSESKNPEPQKSPDAMKFQKVHSSGQVQLKLANMQLGT